jgi:hypothetical protein
MSARSGRDIKSSPRRHRILRPMRSYTTTVGVKDGLGGDESGQGGSTGGGVVRDYSFSVPSSVGCMV